MTETITRKTPIGKIIEKYPQAAEVLLKFGLHCIGCHISAFESLENGLKVHGKSKEEINKVVEEINKLIRKNKE